MSQLSELHDRVIRAISDAEDVVTRLEDIEETLAILVADERRGREEAALLRVEDLGGPSVEELEAIGQLRLVVTP